MTISTNRKQYTTVFKEEALKLARKVSVTEAARELGIHQSQIYGWRSSTQKKASMSKRESGLTPKYLDRIIDYRVNKDISKGQPVDIKHIERVEKWDH